MHSFHQSRGRIFLEVLCALTVSASLVGAWLQTGATALLPAAAAAALYGFAHAFDMRGRKPDAVEPQRIDPEIQSSLPTHEEPDAPLAEVDPQPTTGNAVEDVELVEPATPRAGTGRRKGGARKGDGRQVSAKKEAKVVRLELPAEAEVAAVDFEEAAPSPIAPLFEPEPYLRMPRPAFGRKAG